MILVDIIVFILILSVLILVHELGHFAMAKLFKVYCYEFSLGMGPLLFQHHKEGAETKYSIRALPIGGYVSMAGESIDEAEDPAKSADGKDEEQRNDINVPYERTINGVASWKKMIIVVAGVVMNFILSLVLFIVLYCSVGVPTDGIKLGVEKDSFAYQVGLRTGDEISEIKTVLVGSESKEYVCTLDTGLDKCITSYAPSEVYPTQEYTFTVLRDGEELTYQINRVYDVETTKTSVMGLTFEYIYDDSSFFKSLAYAFEYEWYAIKSLFIGVGNLFTKEGWSQVGGPVAIFRITQDATSSGIFSVISLAGLLSANLGVINLLPIPALDGASFLTSLWETITRKKVNKKIEAIINSIGMIFLMGLMVLILIKDIFF